jgi:hypothetical protein
VSTATLDLPAAAESPAVPECVAPSPEACLCGWCGGTAVEPDEEAGAVPCLPCGGSGRTPAELALGASRSHKLRWATYTPSCVAGRGVLRVQRDRAVTYYDVREFATDPGYGGRALELAKADGECYHLSIGRPLTCDCPGETYKGTAKANQAAWEAGERVYRSHGCVHLDALVPLMAAGWFDLRPFDRDPGELPS